MNSKDIKIQGIGFVLTATGLLKVLWNKLLPELFGWKKITYWQSVMLYVICKALFDSRYTIKDSFNFGNNSINGETVGKKTPAKEAVKATETCTEKAVEKEIKEEMKKELKKEAKKSGPESQVKEEIEVEIAEDDAEVLEFSKKEKN